MSQIRGRTDDMLILRGVNVYPSQVEELLERVPELAPHYRLVVRRERALDEVELEVEVTEGFFRAAGAELLSDEAVEADHLLRALRDRLSYLIKDTIGCTMGVRLMAPGSVPRSEGGKLQRVVDSRQFV